MSYLVVVAHPDDEVLGAGATIYKLTRSGIEVNVCIMSAKAEVRSLRPNEIEFDKNIESSRRMLGASQVIKGSFPNIEMNNVSHIDLVRFIENALIKTNAEIIITHHPSDTNNDHLHTSLACQAAIRLFQRKDNVHPPKELLYMEVLSSTDWSINPAFNKFNPNTFFEIGIDGIEKKIDALSQYNGVMRQFPHPRSREVIKGLAAYRGGQSGMEYAEAFECAIRRISI